MAKKIKVEQAEINSHEVEEIEVVDFEDKEDKEDLEGLEDKEDLEDLEDLEDTSETTDSGKEKDFPTKKVEKAMMMVFETSDGAKFWRINDAENHAKTLGDKQITVNKHVKQE